MAGQTLTISGAIECHIRVRVVRAYFETRKLVLHFVSRAYRKQLTYRQSLENVSESKVHRLSMFQ